MLAGLILAAALTRFWRLGRPAAIVFDELFNVGRGGAYLRGEQFGDPHPPLEPELIALSMRLLGTSNSWAWRLHNAVIGTALVAVTYALGRRLYNSRLAGALAAFFILCDGVFLVDSRLGLPSIPWITAAALSYLLLFRFLQSSDPYRERPTLVWLGIALGLCLGAKLLFPGVTFLLVMGFLTYALVARWPALDQPPIQKRWRLVLGGSFLAGSTAALVYLGVFLPNYVFLGWGGVQALLSYGRDSIWLQDAVRDVTDPRASPWWSWPLMAHPFVYWRETAPTGEISTIWFGGNPVLWWGALGAVVITCIRLITRPSLASAFVVVGYFSYLIIVIPIARPMYLYHFMPALGLAYLALGNVVSECWRGEACWWEQGLLMAAIAASLRFAIGGATGLYAMAVVVTVYGALQWRFRNTGKLVCVGFLAAGLAAFVYFFPIWIGSPIPRASFEARMWLHQPGLFDWAYDTE